VPASAAAPLWGGELSRYDSPLDITLRVNGGEPAGATLTTVVVARSSGEPSRPWDLAVRETIKGGRVLVAGFSMRPAR
jgi:hypothetical protein